MWNNFFENGGFGMYPVSIFGFVVLAAGILFSIRPERRLVPVVVSAAALTVGAGVLGTAVGIVNTLHYVQRIEPVERSTMVAVGCAESLHNLVLALMIVVAAGLLAFVGVVRSARRPASASG